MGQSVFDHCTVYRWILPEKYYVGEDNVEALTVLARAPAKLLHQLHDKGGHVPECFVLWRHLPIHFLGQVKLDDIVAVITINGVARVLCTALLDEGERLHTLRL